ncbi:MAG: hypothetical protein HYU53_04870 [Acidobacteria bacterium]|nr:hypothetical protein [Acidobacteriota bacterium]
MEQLRPSKLWKQMPQERRLEAARAFWDDEQSVEQHPEAVAAIAQQLKFRPKSAAALPVERRARYLAGLPSISDLLASRLLVAYHLARQRPMMGRFLDLLGIAHDDGLISEEDVKRPEKARMATAVKALRHEFPAEDVDLYFATLAGQDPDTWSDLTEPVSA